MTNEVARIWNDVAFILVMGAVLIGALGSPYISVFLFNMGIGIWIRLAYEAWKRGPSDPR